MAEKKKKGKPRKSKVIFSQARAEKEGVERKLKQLEETKKLLIIAEEEEKKNLETTDQEIQALCEEKGMKIGVLITKENLQEVISTLISNGGEPIFIKPVVQFDEDESIKT